MSTGFDRDPDEFSRGARAIVVYPDLGGSSRDAEARLEETAGLAHGDRDRGDREGRAPRSASPSRAR